jgi:hypothetical protein
VKKNSKRMMIKMDKTYGKEDYDKASRYIIKKYDLSDIDDYARKTINYFKAYDGLSAFKAEHHGSIDVVSSKAFDYMLELKEYRDDALSEGRKFYKKFEKLNSHEKRIIASYYLKSKGFEKSEFLLSGNEESLESSVEKCLKEHEKKKEVKKKKKERSIDHRISDEDSWWEDSEMYDD